MLVRLKDRLTRRDDEGSMLVSVLIIMLVLTIGALALSSIVVNTTGVLGDSRSTVQSRAAADAGLSDTIARAQRGEDVCTTSTYPSTAPAYTVSVLCDSGTVTFRSIGTATGGGRTVTEATYTRNSSPRKLAGALVMADGGFKSTNLTLTAPAIDGDLVINKGDFDCNNKTVIAGDVVVRQGDAALSNECHVKGDLVVSGNVIVNNAAVGVDGDVYAGGTYKHTTLATVKGNVYAVGSVTMNSGAKVQKSVATLGSFTIDGDTTSVGGTAWSKGKISVNNTTVTGAVISSSAEEAHVYGSTVGGLRIAGPLRNIQAVTVKGNLSSTSTDQSYFRAGVTVTGDLTISATKATGPTEVAPTVAGTTTFSASQTAPPVPVVSAPWQMGSTAFEWIDLSYSAASWGGYAVRTTPTCDFQSNAANVTAVNGFTTPTIIDLRGCSSSLTLYGATFSLKTDIALIVPPGVNAQSLTIGSADGAKHQFHMIVPDNTANKLPTCPSGASYLNLYALKMDAKISGLAYTPCEVYFGGSGRWNGQIYAGSIYHGATNDFALEYQEVTVPGMTAVGGGGAGAETLSVVGALVSLGDV